MYMGYVVVPVILVIERSSDSLSLCQATSAVFSDRKFNKAFVCSSYALIETSDLFEYSNSHLSDNCHMTR